MEKEKFLSLMLMGWCSMKVNLSMEKEMEKVRNISEIFWILKESKNGKRWEGIEYDFMNQPLYELKDGKGKEIMKYDNNNSIGYEFEYTGDYLNREKFGIAEEHCVQTNLTYKGEFF